MPKKVYTKKQPLTASKYITLKTISNTFVFLGVSFLFLAFGPIFKDEIWYKYKQIRNQDFVLFGESSETVKDSVFSRYLSTRPISIVPVNTNSAIIIEKIGVNVPIVLDVPVTDEAAYLKALEDGVAHASISQYPSEEPGNTYLFAHASTNFWKLGKYATVFNLLRKLDIGDRIHIFYDGEQFVYEVVNKEVLKGWNTYPITRPVIEPTLTLQTCDPPGTTINRLVITSKLIEVR